MWLPVRQRRARPPPVPLIIQDELHPLPKQPPVPLSLVHYHVHEVKLRPHPPPLQVRVPQAEVPPGEALLVEGGRGLLLPDLGVRLYKGVHHRHAVERWGADHWQGVLEEEVPSAVHHSVHANQALAQRHKGCFLGHHLFWLQAEVAESLQIAFLVLLLSLTRYLLLEQLDHPGRALQAGLHRLQADPGERLH